MRISDWSSDVCSSDLLVDCGVNTFLKMNQKKCAYTQKVHMPASESEAQSDGQYRTQYTEHHDARDQYGQFHGTERFGNHGQRGEADQIGRASWRERESQYV